MLLKRVSVICAAILFFLFVLPSPAHAYLDPGTGSYIFQLLLAALVGLGFLIKVYWKKIKSFFARLFSRASTQDVEHEDE